MTPSKLAVETPAYQFQCDFSARSSRAGQYPGRARTARKMIPANAFRQCLIRTPLVSSWLQINWTLAGGRVSYRHGDGEGGSRARFAPGNELPGAHRRGLPEIRAV